MKNHYTNLVTLIGPIQFESVNGVITNVRKILEKGEKSCTLMISSGGGMVDVGNMLVDVLPGLVQNLTTIGTGMVGSMAIPVFLCAPKGNRLITSHTRFFFHEIGRNYTNTRLGVGEVESDLRDLKALQKWYIDFVAENTRLSTKKISDLMRDETMLYPDNLLRSGFAKEII